MRDNNIKKKKHMISLARRACTSVPFRGEFEYHMLGYFNPYICRTTEYHFLSVHNMTHLEAPVSQFFPKGISTNIYDHPKAMDAIVLQIDMPNLDETCLEETIYGKYLKRGIDETEFCKVLSELAVTQEKIKKKLRQIFDKKRISGKDLKNKFLLISTNWQKQYYPKIKELIDYNMNNSYFESFHPYFIHPYLDHNDGVLEYIFKDLQCGGMALESPSINYPLFHANPEHSFPSVTRIYRYAQKFGFLPKKKHSIDEFILKRLRSREEPFYFLKNINFDKLQNKERGCIYIYPFGLLKDDWGIAGEVFFVENQTINEQEFIAKLETETDSVFLTRTPYEICSKRGFMRPEKLRLLEGDMREEHAPTIHFVPSHSTTHFDIYYDSKDESWYEQYMRPISIEAIVLDLRDRIRKMEKYITAAKEPFALPIPILKKDIAENYVNILKLLEELEITEEELKRRLDGEETEGKFLIFNTGWDIFKPTRSNLNNRFWELHHAYLCHPYLSMKGANYLSREKKIAGIGTDATLLENPVIYADRNAGSGSKDSKFDRNPQVIEKVISDSKHKPYLETLKSKGDVPCRRLFVKNKKDFLYLKNIRCIDEVFDNSRKKKEIVTGRLELCPLTSILPITMEEMHCYSELEKEKNKQIIVIGLPCEVTFYPYII